MSITSHKVSQRVRRHARIRAKVVGTGACPRLSVFRSNCFIYAQLVDDETNTTIFGTDSRKLKGKTALLRAREVGQLVAKAAKEKGIERVVFDRGGFQYKGAVVELAEGAREGGLTF